MAASKLIALFALSLIFATAVDSSPRYKTAESKQGPILMKRSNSRSKSSFSIFAGHTLKQPLFHFGSQRTRAEAQGEVAKN
uniref:Uncharacterized protein n=1 Tax=Plectus sambesii TaxID=2011161 RepID=A0A914W177_9BILA